MGGWWTRGTPEKRIAFSAVALLLWAGLVATKIRHPRGPDWIFLIAAPVYLAFFVVQIRRALSDRRAVA